ncbi:MAG: DUF3090 domain-containing protein [Anaerolineales bacterium]|nr:DUF3090 domain-containing protein [Anaerolineales bacterium]MCB9127854.1 DUF3090 domain-containing protein [Ardenticatenales bacterium]MCB9172962.1 DUF3090 domain-containing protein [Ardenticatenales bacterium]
MALLYNMNPTSRITIGTIGEPGERTFYLQANQGENGLSLIIEKTQAVALSAALSEMLGELEERFERAPVRPDRISPSERELQPPTVVPFRVAQIGIGYDEDEDKVVIVAQAMTDEEEVEPDIARFWISRDQAAALSEQAVVVAGQGRPICPLCGQPMAASGHICARTNGNANH